MFWGIFEWFCGSFGDFFVGHFDMSNSVHAMCAAEHGILCVLEKSDCNCRVREAALLEGIPGKKSWEGRNRTRSPT